MHLICYSSAEARSPKSILEKCRRSLAGIFVMRPNLAQLFFTSEQTLFSSGMKASSAGMVAISL
jgi:hypothetical protein